MSETHKIKTVFPLLFSILLLVLTIHQSRAQCVLPQTRYYTSSQQVNAVGLSSVTSAANAADGDPATYSTLNRTIAVLSNLTQFIKFDNPVSPGSLIAGGTPVTIKLTIPSGLLSVLGGVEIQPFKNLHDGGTLGGGWQADAVGSAISGSSLLGLLSGVGDQEVTITPSADFEGVWVRMSGVAVGQSMKIYDAYFMRAGSSDITCNTAIDVLSGVKSLTDLASIGSVLGSVSNPSYAIDNSTSTYAEINAVANVANAVFHTTVFASPMRRGDTVKMILQNTGPGILDLTVGSGFSVQRYYGSTAVGGPIQYSTSSLSLKLFDLGSSKYELDISPPSDTLYDRIQVSVGGVATLGLTQGLRIYDVKRISATPLINSHVTADTITICYGSPGTLAVSNTQDCTTYKWYDADTNTLLHTDSIYTLPTNLSVGTHKYYVTASRDGCTETLTSATTTVIVNPLPSITPTTAKACLGATSTTLNYTGGVNDPDKYSIVWDSSASSFANIANATLPSATNGAIAIAIPAGTTAGTYTGNLTVKNAKGCTSDNIPISVAVKALPAAPVLTLTY